MFKPFDVTMRDIYGIEPAAWPEFLGFPIPAPELIEVIDSNLSTITADADKLLRIGGPSPFIFHLEFLFGRDKGYPEQALWYKRVYEKGVRACAPRDPGCAFGDPGL